jgi:hypothetical protein
MTNSNDQKDDIDPIDLPISEGLFKHLQNARCFGIDIGGSLVKIAYSSSYECKTSLFYEVYLA